MGEKLGTMYVLYNKKIRGALSLELEIDYELTVTYGEEEELQKALTNLNDILIPIINNTIVKQKKGVGNVREKLGTMYVSYNEEMQGTLSLDIDYELIVTDKELEELQNALTNLNDVLVPIINSTMERLDEEANEPID